MHASVLTKYANFLKNVNNNMSEAERYYRKVKDLHGSCVSSATHTIVRGMRREIW